MLKIATWNVNSIRTRIEQVKSWLEEVKPDVLCLQETKVNDPDFPLDVIEEIGYHPEYWGQKGHYGVAILSKEKPIKTVKGFKKDITIGDKQTNRIDEYKKYLMPIPANHITRKPLIAISKAVPRSGCVITKATGMNKANVGIIIDFKLFTS